MTVREPISMFYHDVDPSVAAKAVADLQTHALSAFETPFSAPAWEDKVFEGRRAYIKCDADSAVPPFVQDLLLNGSGVDWNIRQLDMAHSPFLKAPDVVGEVVNELVEGFAKLA
jgi:hypothetical protein